VSPAPGAPADIIGQDPRLGPLQSPAAGLPLVHTPFADSLAIDKIPFDYCVDSFDEVNTYRPQGSACDMGAVERKK
jgi:hypothetical protein